MSEQGRLEEGSLEEGNPQNTVKNDTILRYSEGSLEEGISEEENSIVYIYIAMHSLALVAGWLSTRCDNSHLSRISVGISSSSHKLEI
uniref:Uncharacterized protein n=1 Tax=Trichogramma kaykai TaxID=54128 RepID=A0ABD2WKQ8_9HYME